MIVTDTWYRETLDQLEQLEEENIQLRKALENAANELVSLSKRLIGTTRA